MLSSVRNRLTNTIPSRMYLIFAAVLLVIILSIAGLLTGLVMFAFFALRVDLLAVAGSSLLLSASATTLAASYLWLTT